MTMLAGTRNEIMLEAQKHLEAARMRGKFHTSTPYILDEIEWGPVEIVITNLEFEGIDGLEFVRRIRKKNKPKYRRVPILVLAENPTRDRIIEIIEAGVSDILLCPYDPATLRIRASQHSQSKYKSMLREFTPEDVQNLPEEPTQEDLDALLLVEDAFKDFKDPLIRVQQKNEERRKARELSSIGEKQLITYDFKHPARVSREQTRTIENLHTNLARMMASAFSTFARQIVDVDIAFVDQTTYAEFIMSLSNPSISYTYTINPLAGPAVIDFSTPITYAFIERQLGGPGGRRPGDTRPLTAIERSVMTPIITRVLADLEATWEPLLKIQVSDAELETNPEFMQVAAPSDTVVLIAFEVNFQRASGLVNLCYPYFTLEPAMSLFNVQNWASRDTRRRKGSGHLQDRLDQLKTIDTEVSAFAGYGSLPANQLAGLQEGDTIVLDTRKTDPSVVFVENIPTFYAQPGMGPSDNYAIEIDRSIPIDEARKYNWHREGLASRTNGNGGKDS
jgi:flagellar motor switch protein FliM